MRKSLLHHTTLPFLSLLGLSTPQTVNWNPTNGFTVDNAATSSQEVLLPASSSASVNPIPPPIRSSLQVATSSPAGLTRTPAVSSFSVTLPTPSASPGTVSTPLSGTSVGSSAANSAASSGILTASSSSANGNLTTSASASRGPTAASSASQVQSSGGAVPMKRLGYVGVLAGAAGVIVF
ncbi:hypothetical protein CC86DRAFT_142299 [Ophiobolus disseminans]|uniref:Uncharacterized protein n=1 Tax=Ophiobolus disseminans TaxID=1469910 RepID=A0A6A7AG68_9PLEO|nr:hypothetical protein CC86DRAFT_142299 [Ophiobolus disseminans]